MKINIFSLELKSLYIFLALCITTTQIFASPNSHGKAKSPNTNSKLISIVDNNYEEVNGIVDVKVGERVQLSCLSKNQGHPITSIKWTFPDGNKALFKYEPTTGKAEKVELSESQLTDSSNKISFFWATGGVMSLICSGSVRSQNFSKTVKFNIKRPTIVMDSFVKGVELSGINGTNAVIKLGDAPVNGYQTEEQFGIRIKVRDDLYNKLEPYEEDWCFVQTVNVGRSGVVPGYVWGGATWHDPDLGVDAPQGQWFYNKGSKSLYDAPAQSNNARLEGYGTNIYRVEPLNIDEYFETYFMYKSTKSLSSWVPIAVIRWSWTGTVSTSSAGFQDYTPRLFSPSSRSDNHSSDTTHFPEWTSNAGKKSPWVKE